MLVISPLIYVLAAAFAASLLTNLAKRYIDTQMPPTSTERTVLLQAINTVTAIVASLVLYTVSNPTLSLGDAWDFVAYGVLAALASFAHFHLSKNANGTVTVVPDANFISSLINALTNGGLVPVPAPAPVPTPTPTPVHTTTPLFMPPMPAATPDPTLDPPPVPTPPGA